MNDTPDRSRRSRAFAFIDWPFLIVATLSLSAATMVLVQRGTGRFIEILEEDALLFLSVLPKVALGTLIGAFVRVLVRREQMAKLVGEGSGLRGLTIATLAGALFPGGPFTIFPLAAAFLIGGADRGATIAFITSWLLLGINRAIVWEMPFFGPDFVLLRVALSLPLPILIGWVARLPLLARLDPPAAP